MHINAKIARNPIGEPSASSAAFIPKIELANPRGSWVHRRVLILILLTQMTLFARRHNRTGINSADLQR